MIWSVRDTRRHAFTLEEGGGQLPSFKTVISFSSSERRKRRTPAGHMLTCFGQKGEIQASWGWYVHKGGICIHPAQETLELVDSPFSGPVWGPGLALGYWVHDNVQPCGWIISAVPGWQRHLCSCLAHPFPRSKLTRLLHSCTDLGLGGEPSGNHTLFSKECIQTLCSIEHTN